MADNAEFIGNSIQCMQKWIMHNMSVCFAYNKAITPGTAGETYSQEAIMAASRDYDDQLNLSGNGIMGYVKIPKLYYEAVTNQPS